MKPLLSHWEKQSWKDYWLRWVSFFIKAPIDLLGFPIYKLYIKIKNSNQMKYPGNRS